MKMKMKQKKFQSPSLTIMKPNLNSMFSIFNRIFGIYLYGIILINLIIIFYKYYNQDFLLSISWNVGLIEQNSAYLLSLKTYLYRFLIISNYILIFHVVYSAFKIFIRTEKIYQLISSSTNIINKLNLFILLLCFFWASISILAIVLIKYILAYGILYSTILIFLIILLLKFIIWYNLKK